MPSDALRAAIEQYPLSSGAYQAAVAAGVRPVDPDEWCPSCGQHQNAADDLSTIWNLLQAERKNA